MGGHHPPGDGPGDHAAADQEERRTLPDVLLSLTEENTPLV